jgi:hypothetical protein
MYLATRILNHHLLRFIFALTAIAPSGVIFVHTAAYALPLSSPAKIGTGVNSAKDILGDVSQQHGFGDACSQ